MTKYITEKGSRYVYNDGGWYKEKGEKKLGLDEAYVVYDDVLEEVIDEYELKKGDFINENKKNELVEKVREGETLDEEKKRILFFIKKNVKFGIGVSSLIEEKEGTKKDER